MDKQKSMHLMVPPIQLSAIMFILGIGGDPELSLLGHTYGRALATFSTPKYEKSFCAYFSATS